MRSLRPALVLVLQLSLMAVFLSQVSLARPCRQVHIDPKVVAKLTQILENSGYAYKKAADNVWVISVRGKSIDIDVLVTCAENLIIIGTVVASKISMRITPEMMFKLLRLAHDIDRVKIGFDSDEDLFLRVELKSKWLDVEEFRSAMLQVSAGADRVHAAIKSYLVK